MANANSPIGIFDSGIGGLTVVAEIIKTLPNEEIIYFGDTARVPYGSKSKETVTKFSKQIVNFLVSNNVKAIIVACNTVSSNSYGELKECVSLPMVEVVSAGVLDALSMEDTKTIGVIGTEATIRSKAYERLIHEKNSDIKVYSKACPLFVPLVEEGWTGNTVTRLTAEIYLQELIDKDIDTLLLGCTHYPFLIKCIKDIVGNIRIVNPSLMTALKMKEQLEKNNLINTSGKQPQHKFFVSDNTVKFDKISKLLLINNCRAGKVDIDSFSSVVDNLK